ncbi:hypothetical protein HK097_000454 [Rhizophlyctis rosea]|uniref:Uncharacterized protein n=1 Tax=Rhizophlyctis rosea TaxID=64517 RepID=A0AAD5S814_9FUNG|nr:hypothetical protein HK097_000454 [Rhizophlyctis rosea]
MIIGDLYQFWWQGQREVFYENGAKDFGAVTGLTTKGAKNVIAFLYGNYGKHIIFFVPHVMGSLSWALWPIQFSKTIRRKYPAIHRKVGQLLLLSMIPTNISALALGFVSPIGLPAKTFAVVGSTYIAYQVSTGYTSILSRNIPLHQLCMTRLSIFLMSIPFTRISITMQDSLYQHWYGQVSDDRAAEFNLEQTRIAFWANLVGWLVVSEVYAGVWRWRRGARKGVGEGISNVKRTAPGQLL